MPKEKITPLRGKGNRVAGPRRPLTPRKNQKIITRPLTPKQQAFVERYLLYGNGTRAYREAFPDAGYERARTGAAALLRDGRISSQIRERTQAVAKKLAPTQERVMQEMAAIAFSDIRDYFDENGAMRKITDLPGHSAAALKKAKTREIIGKDPITGDPMLMGYTREIETHDKVAALRLIGVGEGMFQEKVEIEIGTGFAEALRMARARAIEGKAKEIIDDGATEERAKE